MWETSSWRRDVECTCGGHAWSCQCAETVARKSQRDRLQLVTTELPPKKAGHAKMLKRHAKLNTFVRCPSCGRRGGLYYLHTPVPGETRWCYQCGYKD